MRWVAWLAACAGCDALFRVDGVNAIDAPPGTLQDARADARHDGTSGSGFCATQANFLLCADFETGMTGISAFPGLTNAGIGSLSLDPNGFASPTALAAATSGGTNSIAMVDFAPIDRTFVGTLDFEVAVTASCSQTVAKIVFPSGAGYELAISGGAMNLSYDVAIIGGTCSPAPSSIFADITKYNAVHIGIDMTKLEFTLTIGGTSAMVSCADLGNGGTGTLGLGVDSRGGTCSTLIDNVVIAGSG
jgi:hypothetical protein